VEAQTPQRLHNRPGLSALSYRVGTHASFMSSMLAALSGKDAGALKELRTRDHDDATITLMDAWATVADVLTFYQERIANEGYLRTATERRSLLEMARLVGYKPKQGVAADTYLAYTLDDNSKDEVLIPKGSRVQSIPGPGEVPQTFETGEDLLARARWNNLKPRMTKPQTPQSIKNDPLPGAAKGHKPRIYLQGIVSSIKPNDPLLIDFGEVSPFSDEGCQSYISFFRISMVRVDTSANMTLVLLGGGKDQPDQDSFADIHSVIDELLISGVTQPKEGAYLRRTALSLSDNDRLRSESRTGLMSLLSSRLKKDFPVALSNRLVKPVNIKAYQLGKALLFGHNALKEPQYEARTLEEEPPRANPKAGNLKPQSTWAEWGIATDEEADVLFLDRSYPEIKPNTHIVIEREGIARIFLIDSVQYLSRNAYGMSGETTRIKLSSVWWEADFEESINDTIRKFVIYFQKADLELAPEPITKPVCYNGSGFLELDDYYDGLFPGQWIIVAGEQSIKGTRGVAVSERAMIANVYSGANTPYDKEHTYLELANKLTYCYKRDTVRIYGNVVKATHGETRQEVLGSGNGATPLQAFALKQPPLTYLPASTIAGTESTLKVYVNNVQWEESATFIGLTPSDRRFVTSTDDENKTTITFGNGWEGTRLPTGIENIKAEYRSGIGKAGNVRANQLSLLVSRPLGVKEVTNPLSASGGADRESRDQIRKHAPLAIKALDRLVSVQDYADFTRVFAGIGKSHAVMKHRKILITIAGEDDSPIIPSSNLYRSLQAALRRYGDPLQPFSIASYEPVVLVISANIRILPTHRRDQVEAQVRETLLDTFSFARRELGQAVYLSEAISTIQSVPGVDYVDVDTFKRITLDDLRQSETLQTQLTGTIPPCITAQIPGPGNVLEAAQLATLRPDTLFLNQIH